MVRIRLSLPELVVVEQALLRELNYANRERRKHRAAVNEKLAYADTADLDDSVGYEYWSDRVQTLHLLLGKLRTQEGEDER